MKEISISHKVIQAYAKLTLDLKVFPRITGGRFENYHPIEATMTSLDLADTLEISEGDEIVVKGKYASDIPADNLVVKTLNLLGIRKHVILTKNIPPGGGLGGASTDSGALIRWALTSDDAVVSHLAKKLLDDLELVALKLGADVPFCINGGLASVSGIGEVIKPIQFQEKYFLLFILPFSISTKAVYEMFDQCEYQVIDQIPNNLLSAAIKVEPRLHKAIDAIQEKFGIIPRLAGSGSTLFYEMNNGADTLDGVTEFKSEVGSIDILKVSSVNSMQ